MHVHTYIFPLQYSKGCLDVALQLLQGLSAEERRSAATITKNIVAQVATNTSALKILYFCQVIEKPGMWIISLPGFEFNCVSTFCEACLQCVCW